VKLEAAAIFPGFLLEALACTWSIAIILHHKYTIALFGEKLLSRQCNQMNDIIIQTGKVRTFTTEYSKSKEMFCITIFD